MTVRSFWSVRAVDPLQLTRSRALGEVASTLPYVPGTAMRGALGAALAHSGGTDDPAFRELMEGSSFGNLYPMGEAAQSSAPLPRSCVTCGRQPGFLADGGHGVGDLLLAAEAATLRRQADLASTGPAGATAAPSTVDLNRLLTCPRCGDEGRRSMSPSTIAWPGYVQWQDDGPHVVASRRGFIVHRPAATRGGSGAEAASAGQTLLPGQRFGGTVTFPTNAAAATAVAVLEASDGMLWVGAGRSRGLGSVQIEAEELSEADDDLQVRYDGLMAALTSAVGHQGGPQLDGQTYLSVTLQSAALLPDAFGRWQVTLDGDYFAGRCGLPAGSLQVRQAFTGSTPVEGWNAILNLPKVDAMAIAVGSCWLLRLEGIGAAEGLAALAQLEREGIGERRQEGFGVLRVCDPAHWRLDELEQEQPQ